MDTLRWGFGTFLEPFVDVGLDLYSGPGSVYLFWV